MDTTNYRQTPLLAAHLRLNARMVPFAGWNMPVQYSGITTEHLAVRNSAGIFDISHMGEFFIRGEGAGSWLNGMLTNNTSKLHPGAGQYTLMLNSEGGVIDDLIAYQLGAEEWLLVVNASMIDEDRVWMEQRLAGDVRLNDESSEWAGMAVQGPQASGLYQAVAGEGVDLPERNGIMRFSLDGETVIVCRTGYTGEDGFEFFCNATSGEKWWDRFVSAGACPCGLGARDTLRLEMGYPLNGNDLSPLRTPLEAGLGFFVDLTKGDFVGRDVCALQKEKGLPSRLAALRIMDKAPPPRAHYPVVHEGAAVGELCSGGVSPSLQAGIGMAYLPPPLAKTGTVLAIEIRGKAWPAEVVKKPFLSRSASA